MLTLPISLANVSDSFVASDATYPILSTPAHCDQDIDAKAQSAPAERRAKGEGFPQLGRWRVGLPPTLPLILLLCRTY